MKYLILLCLFAGPAFGVNGPCPQTSGTLTLNSSVTRISGISPLTVWLDNTLTTDSATLGGQNNTFQDVQYSINFGDTLGSGTRLWAYGSNATSRGGSGNKMNLATGPIAAHTYITEGRDTKYTITVTAKDGTNTVSCGLGVTAFDPAGANGFATKVCQSVSGNFTNCPAGYTHSTSAAVTTNTSSAMTNKQVLFNCGETYTGNMSLGGTKFSVGAYGTCTNASPTAANGRPIVHGITMSNVTTDGRVADLDMEGTGGAAYGFQLSTLNTTIASQITLVNLYVNNWGQDFYWVDANQVALVNSFAAPTASTTIQANFFNYGGHNCTNGVTPGPLDTYQCGVGAGATYINLKYSMAIIGDSFDGASQSQETVRIPASRYGVLTNSDYLNAQSGKAVLKFHSNNSWTSSAVWIGAWTEYNEISDNYFAGNSGWLVEISPQNSLYDERIRNIIFERNSLHPSASTTHLEVSANNFTARDNVMQGGGEGFGYGTRGTEGGTAGGAPAMTMSTLGEFYNNSCSGLSSCVNFDNTFGGGAAGSNSFAQNNIASGGTVVANSGTGNSINSNSPNTALSPGFTNGSGTLNVIPDWKPTANYTGGTSVPNFYDALGTLWSPTWSLGAVHP